MKFIRVVTFFTGGFTVRVCGLALLLCAGAASAAGSCDCRGRGTIFANTARYLDVRVDRFEACGKQACDLLPGKLRRLHYSSSSVRDRAVKRYLSRSGRSLAGKAPGYRFGFHYSVSKKDGALTEVWSIDRQ